MGYMGELDMLFVEVLELGFCWERIFFSHTVTKGRLFANIHFSLLPG
jgi:hypothetical protein